MKVKRDRIFVIVMGLVLANLTYWLAGCLMTLIANVTSAWHWAVTLADLTAIIGVLWILRSYKQGRKEARDEQRRAQEEEKPTV